MKRPHIFYTKCKRCGTTIASSRWAMTHPLGQICGKCITPEEKERIIEEQAGIILKKGRKYNPTKIPYEHLPPRGYRKCSFCGDITYTRRYKRKDLCKKCYARKKKNPQSLYESFHGVEPLRRRNVFFEEPKGEIIKIGRLVRIEYEPEPPSKLTGNRYTHEAGDLGHKIIKSNAILATNKKGTQLYIVRENKKVKFPRFSSRGIIG